MLEQCGKVLRHGIFIAEPLIFAYILAVLVHHNAASCRQCGFRQGENPIGILCHCSCRFDLFLIGLQKRPLTERQRRFVRMLLEHK